MPVLKRGKKTPGLAPTCGPAAQVVLGHLLKSKKRPRLEKEIQAKFKEEAYKKYGRFNLETGKGLLQILKLTTLAMYGEPGWEDHEIFIAAAPEYKVSAQVVLIEWKRPGEHSTDIQRRRQAEHKAMGFEVRECDTVEKGMAFLEEVIGW